MNETTFKKMKRGEKRIGDQPKYGNLREDGYRFRGVKKQKYKNIIYIVEQ